MDEEKSLRGGSEGILNLPFNSSLRITYHPLFPHRHQPNNQFLLLELDPTLLPYFYNNQVTVRGDPDEEAVLCTPSSTYALKFVSTSNSVFLIPPPSFENPMQKPLSSPVIELSPGHMELLCVAPQLDKLKSLLSTVTYNPNITDDEGQEEASCLFTWSDLISKVQASDQELKDRLNSLSAIEINGKWRILDQGFMSDTLELLIRNATIHGWPLGALREDLVLPVLEADGVSLEFGCHCLKAFGREKDVGVWALCERAVCVNYARKILGKVGKMKSENFLMKLQRRVPEGFAVGMEMLEGEVLAERVGAEVWVRAFSVSSLPSDPAERFSILFKERQRWESQDLEPYIRDLRVPCLSSDSLLIKYTRRIQPTADSVPIFTAR
ncbi:hypothetical protein AMTRI_Chr03g142330 [Amborella trichopoda]|uniref:Sister chromatid cohesion protein DCC1 n=1 Tax=Amborella trichopoda TaxID=13333 RepID=W1PMX5_AMBTC|nr:sister chromatid cohesion protein DCC1 [Amborella trichopoda]ERN09144.1 hypothetical protein AMTR_s00014p00198100 [Amborella trichopoda]|eukprot:XP_006847563.1 sister chromatid cohesion protein DCC1 [Amborella trichopoda]